MRPRLAGLGAGVLLTAACWYHRVDVPSPVTYATDTARTKWSFLWHSKRVAPAPSCVSASFKEVTVRSNWGFSLLSVATLGLVSAVRVHEFCARAIIVDEATPDSAVSAVSSGATFLSIGWGRLKQREPMPECNGRGMATVILKPNPFFDLLSAISGGGFSAARIRWTCVPKG